MTLREAREVFKRIKGSCTIMVHRHAVETDRQKRRFTDLELVDLVRNATSLGEPVLPSARGNGSFLLRVKDDRGNICELGIKILGNIPEEYILVIHAYREIVGRTI
jgi:hypothetical protein